MAEFERCLAVLWQAMQEWAEEEGRIFAEA
jgi:hypothetical protein